MEENFIQLVIGSRFLYDKSHTDFKNGPKKERAWQEIGENFGISGEEVSKLFKSMRKKYSRIKRKKDTDSKSGSGASKQKEWHLFELMRFIDEVLKPRQTASSILNKPSQSSQSLSVEIEVEDGITIKDLLDESMLSSDSWVSTTSLNLGQGQSSTPQIVKRTV
ncbi:unnamed protein product [Brassicogethes aeneus]|uniref:MADF domain-containing protein n=1 Tax=Brassicogethes aeneus TaxID=1431903 RepID=A0A9P0AT93_BRAAE|nr:unnamed protein product [Brassicogethes aeneus]